MQSPSPASVMAAVEAGRFAQASQELQRLIALAPKDLRVWMLAAEVAASLGQYDQMKTAVERASRLGAPPAECDRLRARAAGGSGRVEEAILFGERAVRGLDGAARFDAALGLAQSLYFAQRFDELARLVEAERGFCQDPRGSLFLARVARSRGDHAMAEAKLRELFEAKTTLVNRRIAGFDLVQLLDSLGRYAEAFEVARATHLSTTPPFDTRGLVADLDRTASLARRGAFRIRHRPTRRVASTALFSSLPRSGTTLLEQMLDRHPGLRGLGEIPAVEEMALGLTSLGGWPDGAWLADVAALDRLQAAYLDAAKAGATPQAGGMTLDKTLGTWMRLPAVATVLPGAKLLRLLRDPRDNAISLFLSSLDRVRLGWSGSLDSIRQVIAAERRCVPVLAETLELDLLSLSYEGLVDDPRGKLEATLAFLGLPWHEECLRPDLNQRVVVTLSHAQVRKPVNRGSIGRWRNYAEFFGPEWDELASP